MIQGINPVTGERLEGVPLTTAAELEQVFERAQAAVRPYANLHKDLRAAFLRQIAAELENVREEITSAAHLETALPMARLNGELTRTTGQLKLFADVVQEGSWVDARIDPALPERTPPRPDIRSMLVPLGVVGVFGASNFPLAFSVAGGDTASALAAGCPVIVKGHNAHPRTGYLAGEAIQKAVQSCGLPEGVFSLVFGADNQIGETLVQHPAVKAVGFTGSRAGGLALTRLAQQRKEPIPVYAEMSSINPMVVFPGAMHERPEALARGLHASFTLGAGQFCTNPGLVCVPAGSEVFLQELKTLTETTGAFHLLTSGIEQHYASGITQLKTSTGVDLLAQGSGACPAHVFRVEAKDWNDALQQEVFGPSTVLCLYQSLSEVESILQHLEGQLTASAHIADSDRRAFADLLPVLQDRAGRVIVNGYPTGVEVCHAMVHGGPYPSTTDPRSTSVGTRAIVRFTRLSCYQDFPDDLLPEALQESNPLNIRRLREGKLE
ncbi:aldehyde dehydrogenase (NADP(+)) [Deinococcus cellulosilyticus]|uniref:2,5-dioxovalerate dehydrogenase n=1 Tax=Deinococcus cellulosilyticus (strain DSM 18568 / NBRC 106333 / KACC 11606 / 5516J-15) TaxID=1223518 RepID=A0A511N711_DEIC1|nr:aldehyde dehydrogenase (NADP(+)) [Deinococcus cellulosilyticus]GEM48267.1 2,5-dioxovalerate dehydrogenase [Deinococcus cellulosilyticus NBRC 106333 = KACC 11606]